MESAGDDLHRGMTVASLPGLRAPDKNGTIVPVANAVQQVHVDLPRAQLHANPASRQGTTKLEETQAGRLASPQDRLVRARPQEFFHRLAAPPRRIGFTRENQGARHPPRSSRIADEHSRPSIRALVTFSLAVARLLARSAGGLEEIFSLLAGASEERQRCQRKEQHR
jgi:hypothetical protein